MQRKHYTTEQAAIVLLLAIGILVASFFYLVDSPKAQVAINYRVSINLASPKELQTLPGVGPERARRLCDCRKRQGPFRNLDDIRRRMPGWGKKTLSRLAPFVKFD